MLAETTKSLATIAGDWLARFERALGRARQAALASLFHADSHWRDVLALTWDIRTVTGAAEILPDSKTAAAKFAATNFRIDPKRTPPREVTRAGTDAIEAIFTFETAQARCNGVVRLTADGGTFKAWNLLTATRRDQRPRGAHRPHAPPDRRSLRARLPRPELARSAPGRPPPTPTAIPKFSSSAAARPASPSPRA